MLFAKVWATVQLVNMSDSAALSSQASSVSIPSLRKVLTDKGVGAAQWMEIGTHLELDFNKLEAIECSHPRSPERCLLEVLHRWTKKCPKSPTLENFKKAMRSVSKTF